MLPAVLGRERGRLRGNRSRGVRELLPLRTRAVVRRRLLLEGGTFGRVADVVRRVGIDSGLDGEVVRMIVPFAVLEVDLLAVGGEDGHQRVTAELDDVPPVRVDDLDRTLEEDGQRGAQLLGAGSALLAEALRKLRVAGDVEEDEHAARVRASAVLVETDAVGRELQQHGRHVRERRVRREGARLHGLRGVRGLKEGLLEVGDVALERQDAVTLRGVGGGFVEAV